MSRFLIDADSAISAMAGRHAAMRTRFEACSPGDIAISAISYAEIARSTYGGKPPSPKTLASFLAVVPLLPFDEAAARKYAQLPFRRARFDRLLAAHALSLDATIVTNNEGDFADVPGLKIENWAR